jgi:hypothetical protein
MDESLRQVLRQKAVELEKKRKKAVKLNYLYRISEPLRKILLVVAGALAIINFIFPLLIPALIVTGVILIVLYMFDDPKEVFEHNLKVNALPEILQHINPTFQYRAEGYNGKVIESSELLAEGFFSKTVGISGEDYVAGQIEGVDVEFFELKFFKKVINYWKTIGSFFLFIILIPVFIIKALFSDGQIEGTPVGIIRDTIVFYSGFFMYADFHKEFKGKVVMIPKKNKRIQDRVFQFMEPKSMKKINIENPFIAANYNIYASDEQMAYYVLSQSFVDKVHTIADAEQALPMLSLIHGKMYFMIPWEKDFFTVDLTIPIHDENYFLPYVSEIERFREIVVGFNLDTRIWSKV